jgi:hypothetical protein
MATSRAFRGRTTKKVTNKNLLDVICLEGAPRFRQNQIWICVLERSPMRFGQWVDEEQHMLLSGVVVRLVGVWQRTLAGTGYTKGLQWA